MQAKCGRRMRSTYMNVLRRVSSAGCPRRTTFTTRRALIPGGKNEERKAQPWQIRKAGSQKTSVIAAPTALAQIASEDHRALEERSAKRQRVRNS